MIRLKHLYINNFKQLQEVDLHFPDSARVLVRGKNEAGKSTLFEAVFFALFGTALATESGTRSLDDLIGYGLEKARVELDVQANARLFHIVRSVVRGKQNVWELDVVRGDEREEIRGNTVVNKRLIAELGFDGDALLNTCFVEQKKLEKLEGLSKAKREESLAKLLNLDALVSLEGDLKIRAEDKQDIERLKKRADLADIQAELPSLEEKLAETEKQLRLIELRSAVDGALEEMQTVQTLDAAIQSLVERRTATAQKSERIEALREAMMNVKEARDAVERAAENSRDIERLKTEQAQAAEAANSIPSLQSQISSLRHLAHLVSQLDQIRAARERYAQRIAQIAKSETRISELNATIAREEQAITSVEQKLQLTETAQALDEWIAAKQDAMVANDVETLLQGKQIARDRISSQFNVQVYGLAALLFVFVVAAAIVQPLWLVFIALALVTLVALAARATMLWRDLARASEDLGRAEGEARATVSTNQTKLARVEQAQARLAQLNVIIPDSVERAQMQHESIVREIGKDENTLQANLNAARERLTNARAVLGELQRQNAIADTANIQREREQAERAKQKSESILSRWQSHIETRAQALGVTADVKAIERARYKIDAEIQQIGKRTNDATRLAQEIMRREEQTQAFMVQAQDKYEQAREIKSSIKTWDVGLEIGDYTAFGKELRADYDALGGDAIIKEMRDTEGELGRRQGERATRQKNVDVLIARIQTLVPSAPNDIGIDELASMKEKLKTLVLEDESTVRAQNRELVGRVRSLNDRQSQLERELGLQGEALDRSVCRADYEEKLRESLVRERGVEIVSVARRRIVQKVLPATMDYMRRILPTITRDRYHDAQLDAESYKIQVWDERAQGGGAFKEKNIFSGGTKDQFSLALRLAFALATLPQERGAAPSFIFLDEPLGSFDDERAEALIYLLTEGEIARAFDQIFLISHVHVDERLFTHRIVLENGRVVFTDLPNE
jgi:exonuclease SbcC